MGGRHPVAALHFRRALLSRSKKHRQLVCCVHAAGATHFWLTATSGPQLACSLAGSSNRTASPARSASVIAASSCRRCSAGWLSSSTARASGCRQRSAPSAPPTTKPPSTLLPPPAVQLVQLLAAPLPDAAPGWNTCRWWGGLSGSALLPCCSRLVWRVRGVTAPAAGITGALRAAASAASARLPCRRSLCWCCASTAAPARRSSSAACLSRVLVGSAAASLDPLQTRAWEAPLMREPSFALGLVL